MNKDESTTYHDCQFRLPYFDIEPIRAFPAESTGVLGTVAASGWDARNRNEFVLAAHEEFCTAESKGSNHMPEESKLDAAPLKDLNATFPSSYVLRTWDIICGRHRLALNHTGNRRFRVFVSLYVKRYFKSTGRGERYLLNSEIVSAIRRSGGSFLQQNQSGEWVEISDKEQHNKVSHALRDAAATFKGNKEAEGFFRPHVH